MSIRVQVRIKGKVQGVWYRAWTEQQATRLGLSGWVRNRTDGSVEALFIGNAEVIEHMMQACYQGPPEAKVIAIEPITETPISAHISGTFMRLPTI
jgi:acylphosphatase